MEKKEINSMPPQEGLVRELPEVADAVLDSNEPSWNGLIQIYENGRKYKTTVTRKFAERKTWVKPDPSRILSVLPGSVASILVKPGDRVKKGQKLMVYEAMKMKNIIAAPYDGIVRKIDVKEKENLPKGSVLIELDAEEKSVKNKKRR